MDIVVCVKRVPATDTKIKVAADGKSIDPAGVEFVLNPYDEFAVEEALRTKEALRNTGSVTVVTLGAADAQKELRTCLAMGADKAVLLESDPAVQHDAYSTSETLARWIRTVPHDLVLLGKQAVDTDNNQMAARLAVLLDMACVTEVAKLTREGDAVVCERDIEGGREVVRCRMPAVLSLNKGVNEPRYASLKGIMAAKKKPLEQVKAEAVAPATSVVSLSLPPERPPGKILADADALVAVLKNEAKVL